MLPAILGVGALTAAAGIGTYVGLTVGEAVYRGIRHISTKLIEMRKKAKPKAKRTKNRTKKHAKILTLRKSDKSATNQ